MDFSSRTNIIQVRDSKLRITVRTQNISNITNEMAVEHSEDMMATNFFPNNDCTNKKKCQ